MGSWAQATITPGTAGLQSLDLPFVPASVVVENASSQPVYFQEIDWWSPPFARVVKTWRAAPGQIARREVHYRADILPAGASALQPAVTEPIRLSWTDELQPERQDSFSSGSTVNTLTVSSLFPIGSVAYVQSGVGVTATLPLPAGATSVSWNAPKTTSRPPSVPNVALTIAGHQSGVAYGSTTFDPATSSATGSAVLDPRDTSIDITFTGPQIAPTPDWTVTLQATIPVLATQISPSLTGTPSSVAGSASSVVVLASNALRRWATVFNDSTANLYLLLQTGGAASLTNYTVKMLPGAYYEVPGGFTGALVGIWNSAAGAARVTEGT